MYRDNGKEHGNYYIGLHRDYYEDPFLHFKEACQGQMYVFMLWLVLSCRR